MTEHCSQDDIGQIECDISLVLVRLHETKMPRQQLQSGALRGYSSTNGMLPAASKLRVKRDQSINTVVK